MTSRCVDAKAVKSGCDTAVADASHAFFHADELEDCYVEPPEEWLAAQADEDGNIPDLVWQLNKAATWLEEGSSGLDGLYLRQAERSELRGA